MTTDNLTDLGERIADLASSSGVTVATAESLTSGAIASALGASPQAGDWFAGGVVAYSEHVKFDVLGVTPGPVITAACAEQMATGVARLLSAGAVVAVTGAGGPGPQEGKEEGTVYLAHGRPGAIEVEELHLDGDPEQVVKRTVDAALAALAGDLEAGGDAKAGADVKSGGDRGGCTAVSDGDDADPTDGRNESTEQRADRNWNELLQEFRVFQTGTQILAAFLLTLPFQQRFAQLPPFDVGVYIVLVFLAVIVTLLALAPVSLHRLLFRQRAKAELVGLGNVILIVCLAAASLLFTGIVLFIVDFLLAPPAGIIAAACVFVLLLIIWIVLPLFVRGRAHRRQRAAR